MHKVLGFIVLFTATSAHAFLAGNPGNSAGPNSPQGRGAYNSQNGNAGSGTHTLDNNGNYGWFGQLPPAHTQSLRPRGTRYRDYQDVGRGGMNQASHRDDRNAANNRSQW